MNKRDLFPLFIINFVVFFIGTGLLPLLPLFAAQFGISSSISGLFIAFIFAAITLGTVLTSRMANRFSTRPVLLISGLLGIPALALLGRSTTFWQVILLTALIWFLAGIGTGMVNVQAGLRTTKEKRGRSFGLMFLALPAASLISGLSIGRLVEWQSFRFMFDALAVIWTLWPVAALLVPNAKTEQSQKRASSATQKRRSPLGPLFSLLVVTTLLSAVTFYLTRLGTSFSLANLGFSPSAITSTTTVGGLAAIPATYLIGSLSDRFSRKHIVVLGYLSAVVATVIMSTAAGLWQFWLATAILYLSRSVNGAVAPALAADLLSRENIGRGLPYLSAGNWLAAIIGSAVAGIGIDTLGQTNLFLLAAGLTGLAAALFIVTFSTPHNSPTQAKLNAMSGD